MPPPDNFISELCVRARASRHGNWNCRVYFPFSLSVCVFCFVFFCFALNYINWLLEESGRVASAAQSSCKVSLGRKWKQLPQYRLLRHHFFSPLIFSEAFRQHVGRVSPGSGRLKCSSSQLCSAKIAQTPEPKIFFLSLFNPFSFFYHYYCYYFYRIFFLNEPLEFVFSPQPKESSPSSSSPFSKTLPTSRCVSVFSPSWRL